jgi:putative transposase
VTQVITAKLKLSLSTEQKALVRETVLAYRDVLNYTSNRSFDNGKSGNGAKLQKLVYNEIRALFALGSQMACNVQETCGSNL